MSNHLLMVAATKPEADLLIQLLFSQTVTWQDHQSYLLASIPNKSLSVCVTGMGIARANAGLSGFLNSVEQAPDVIVGIGFCGALSTRFLRGDTILASEILFHGEPEIRNNHFTGSVKLISSPLLIQTPVQKKLLHDQSKADAVDMESYAWMQVAQQFNCKMTIVRSVLDESQEEISESLSKIVDPFGRPQWMNLFRELFKHPFLIRELLRLRPSILKHILKSQAELVFKLLESQRQTQNSQSHAVV